MNEGMQYESGTSSVQVRMCSTSKVDHKFCTGCSTKNSINGSVISLTNMSGENGQ